MPSATVLPKNNVKKVVGASSVEKNEESVSSKGMLSGMPSLMSFRHSKDKTKLQAEHQIVLSGMSSSGSQIETIVTLTHNYENQHTVSWTEPIQFGSICIEPGFCNVYGFPAVTSGRPDAQVTRTLNGQQLELLSRLLVLACVQTDCCKKPDCTGAHLLHVLLIANTSPSIAVALIVFRQLPELLVQAHADGPFKGEHGLHILAVNRRERDLCALCALARDSLSREQFATLLTMQASGSFFAHPPMQYFGSTLLGYLASFGLKGPIAILLSATKLDASVYLKDARYACMRTGFLPLHAAVANGRPEMFDFLIGRSVLLDETCRAAIEAAVREGSQQQEEEEQEGSSSSPTGVPAEGSPPRDGSPSRRGALGGDNGKRDAHGDRGARYLTLTSEKAARYLVRTTKTHDPSLSRLTPLQLAAKLGDRRMCKHILVARLIFNWRWGPLTSYKMELTEIDSVGSEGNDIMEVVAALDSTEQTRELLLDSFMQGFLHELFLSKWRRFAGAIYYVLRSIDFAYLGVILYQGFNIKISPSVSPAGASFALACVSLALACVLSLIELSGMALWWANQTEFDTSSIYLKGVKLLALWRWQTNFKSEMRLASYVASICGCILYLGGGGGEDDADDGIDFTEHVELRLGAIYLLFALACYGHFRALMQSLFVSPAFPALGVHLITIEKMFANDVSTFLIFLALYVFNYFTSMFITFPKSGQWLAAALNGSASADGANDDTYEELAPFDDPVEALGAIYNMAIFGVRFATNLNVATLSTFNWMQTLNFCMFFFHHSMFAIMCLTLLVRLLMAMMTNTFQSVKKSALLEWRLMIARAVLRHELLFTFAPLSYKLAGERGADGKYYHSFLHVRPDPDGKPHVPLMLAQKQSASLFEDEDVSVDGWRTDGDGPIGGAHDLQLTDEEQRINGSFGASAVITSAPLLQCEKGGSPETHGGATRKIVKQRTKVLSLNLMKQHMVVAEDTAAEPAAAEEGAAGGDDLQAHGEPAAGALSANGVPPAPATLQALDPASSSFPSANGGQKMVRLPALTSTPAAPPPPPANPDPPPADSR